MSANPAFASTPNNGAATITTAETNLTVPTQAVLVFSAGANGSKVEEISAEAVHTTLAPVTVAGVIYLFLYDGTTYWLYDTMAITPVTASATVAPWRQRNVYTNLLLKAATWKLYASASIMPTTGQYRVQAFGGDF